MRLELLVGAIATGYALGADQPGIKDLPDVKEGLWESNTMMPGSMDKPMHTTMCSQQRRQQENLRRFAQECG